MSTLDRSSFKDWVVNPPRDSARGNFIMGGPDGPNLHHRGPEPYAIAGLQGWLSLKTIRKGRGVWVTPDGRHPLDEGFAVILNDGQAYGFELSADEPVETFCAFFRPGFVEDVVRAVGRSEEALLDDPQPAPSGAIAFAERVDPTEPAVCRRLEPLYQLSAADDVEPLAWDEAFADLALAPAVHAGHASLRLGAKISQAIDPKRDHPQARPRTRLHPRQRQPSGGARRHCGRCGSLASPLPSSLQPSLEAHAPPLLERSSTEPGRAASRPDRSAGDGGVFFGRLFQSRKLFDVVRPHLRSCAVSMAGKSARFEKRRIVRRLDLST